MTFLIYLSPFIFLLLLAVTVIEFNNKMGEEAVAYSLARRNAAAVTRESGEVAACFLARERRRWQSRMHDHLHLGAAPDAGQRENTETVAKQKQPPSAGLDTMREARAR